jgi:hypothetical protein
LDFIRAYSGELTSGIISFISSNHHIWSEPGLYKNFYNPNEDLVDLYYNQINWEIFGLYAEGRYSSLSFLKLHRTKWTYEIYMDTSFGIDDGVDIEAGFRSIFDNVNIPWWKKEYQIEFRKEIEIYRRSYDWLASKGAIGYPMISN